MPRSTILRRAKRLVSEVRPARSYFAYPGTPDAQPTPPASPSSPAARGRRLPRAAGADPTRPIPAAPVRRPRFRHGRPQRQPGTGSRLHDGPFRIQRIVPGDGILAIPDLDRVTGARRARSRIRSRAPPSTTAPRQSSPRIFRSRRCSRPCACRVSRRAARRSPRRRAGPRAGYTFNLIRMPKK